MSAHPTPHPAEESGSFWSVANIVLAVLFAGFALFWGGTLFYNGSKLSARGKDQAPATPPEAPAAPAAAAATPAAAAAVSAAPATPAASGPVAEVKIGVNPANPLGYDTNEFTVKSGQAVKLTFNNAHPVPQPHNVVIGKVGTKEKLFAAAMQMAVDPQGMAKGYIPDSPDVLFHTKLVMPNTSETIEFTAPAAGNYPYLCTFPGHGAIMNGIMKVE
jgi:azurin